MAQAQLNILHDYALAALSGIALPGDESKKLNTSINEINFDKSLTEHLAISHFMKQEEKDLVSNNNEGSESIKRGIAQTVKNIINSKKFKEMAKKTKRLLIETKKKPFDM